MPQQAFLININYNKITLRIFLGDVKNIHSFFPKKKLDPHIVKICGGKCVVGSRQCFLINKNYHKIPLRIFLGGPSYCQNMRFKICGRSRSDLKMSNNKHLLLQRPFLININYHKIPQRIFLGDIRIPPDPGPCPP